ncbi:putative PurR-regulated permease PerM [Bradyrhizobium diazoefficiens]
MRSAAFPKGDDVTISRDERPRTRSDLAWAISVGGISVVLVTALLAFTWYFAATLLLIFTGMLLGVGLNALTNALGRRVHLPHTMRLAIVCIALALMLAGVAYLGGATIAEQASLLSKTIRSQITNVKSFLDNHGIDTSFFDFGNPAPAASTDAGSTPTPNTAPRGNLPGAGALASSGGAIVSQTFKLLLGTISAVGNIFIVLFLGLAFAAQPSVYHDGLLFLVPARHRTRATLIVDRISETLERWLIAQIIVMLAVGVVTWIGLAIIGIPRLVHPGNPGRPPRLHPDRRRHHRRRRRGAGESRLGLDPGAIRTDPVSRRACDGELRADAAAPAAGAGHSAGHAVRVPDPARRRLRNLGPGAGAATGRHRQGHDRPFQDL